jgi:hypothetical protein
VIRVKVKYILFVFLALLMYSNLMSRIIGINVNGLFYLAWGMTFIWALVGLHIHATMPWKATYIVLALLMILYIFDFRYNFSANTLSIKDFIIPILSLIIGYRLVKYKGDIINSLNYLYLPFVAYGIIQEILFYKGGLAEVGKVLPWDGTYINSILSQGGGNFFQGPLLRFFGIMNSFVEYQIWVMGIVFLIWVNIDVVKQRKLFVVNLILMTVFLALSLERAPIAMAFVLFVVWKYKYILSRLRYLLIGGTILLAIVIGFIFLGQPIIEKNPLLSNSYTRLANVFTLNFKGDAAIQSRQSNEWAKALSTVKGQIFGVGLETVTPSANMFPRYVGPHNNFLAYYLGYGALGLGLFLVFLTQVALQFSKLSHSYRYFGYGLLLSFAGMAMFNMPFSGKQGILFFLVIGFLLSMSTASQRVVTENKILKFVPESPESST